MFRRNGSISRQKCEVQPVFQRNFSMLDACSLPRGLGVELSDRRQNRKILFCDRYNIRPIRQHGKFSTRLVRSPPKFPHFTEEIPAILIYPATPQKREGYPLRGGARVPARFFLSSDRRKTDYRRASDFSASPSRSTASVTPDLLIGHLPPRTRETPPRNTAKRHPLREIHRKIAEIQLIFTRSILPFVQLPYELILH